MLGAAENHTRGVYLPHRSEDAAMITDKNLTIKKGLGKVPFLWLSYYLRKYF